MCGANCNWAFSLLLSAVFAAGAAAQTPAPAEISAGYQIFVRGLPVGREDVTVRSDANGTTITSQGRLAPPIGVTGITLRRGEVKYGADGTTQSFVAEGTLNNAGLNMQATFANGSATLRGTEGAAAADTVTAQVSPKAVVLPAFMFGGYSALARRLATDPPGTELRVYLVPQRVELSVAVLSVTPEQVQVATTIFPVRRYELALQLSDGRLPLTLVATERGELVRLAVPAEALEVIRADVASPIARTQVFSNPGDEPVVIPTDAGFNLGATITKPTPPAARTPAIVLLGGSGVTDRDGYTQGIPIIGQLAGTLAEAGFLAVRYDKRGFGQSGGRDESATISDYADDARAVVKWLSARKDVDPKRIAILGHDEGAMVALLAASREKRIAAVVSLAGPSGGASELLLEKQQAAFILAHTPQAEREQKMALQRQIEQAVLTGKGWDGIPPNVRKQADTPWFQSVLQYNPTKVIDDLRQPLLIVHGELDQEVAASHADKLAALARTESKSKSVDVVVVRGVNHLLVPAVTGAIGEYPTLSDRTVSADVKTAVTNWLTKTLPAQTR